MLFYLMVLLLKTSLTCVDDKGCLREHCVLINFNEDYKTLIDTSVSKNPDCRYALGSTIEI